MAEIEIAPLGDRLNDDEVNDLRARLDRVGAPALPDAPPHAGGKVADTLDSEALEELLEMLDEHDAAADIYLPVEFDGRVEVAGWRVASAPALLDGLAEVKDELDLAEEEEEEEEDEDEDRDFDDEDSDPFDVSARKTELLRCWKQLSAAATAALEQRLPLIIAL